MTFSKKFQTESLCNIKYKAYTVIPSEKFIVSVFYLIFFSRRNKKFFLDNGNIEKNTHSSNKLLLWILGAFSLKINTFKKVLYLFNTLCFFKHMFLLFSFYIHFLCATFHICFLFFSNTIYLNSAYIFMRYITFYSPTIIINNCMRFLVMRDYNILLNCFSKMK